MSWLLGVCKALRLCETSVVAKISALPTVCGTIGPAQTLARVVFCLLFSLSLLSCNSTRPVIKIGLLAPFEGLHREIGYQALSAMRTALADYPLDNFEALPLALDTSADPKQARRAAVKMLSDESVAAVIGPLQARQVSAVADVIEASGVEWQPQTRPASIEAAQTLIEATIVEMPGKHIIVAGLDFGWPSNSSEEWSSQTGKSVTVVDPTIDAADEVGAADAVLWLGDADVGAAFLGLLRTKNRSVPFWTTAIAGDPVFLSLLLERLDGTTLGPVYWVVELGDSADQYNEWAVAHADAPPSAFAVYLATRRVLQQIDGRDLPPNERKLAVFTLNLEGKSELTEIVQLP